MQLLAYQIAALGQFCLGLSILVSTALMPNYLFSLDQGGISNFGTEDRTRSLFIFGFGAAAVCTLIASLMYKTYSRTGSILKAGMAILSAMYVLVLLSTFSYKLSSGNETLHHLAALMLFMVMVVYAVWLRFIAGHDPRVSMAFILFCISILLSIGTLINIWHLLFIAQLLGGISFGYMLVYSIKLLDAKSKT